MKIKREKQNEKRTKKRILIVITKHHQNLFIHFINVNSQI